MERTVSAEERIRRAEEIYQRRRIQGVRVSSNTVNVGNNPDFSLFKRMLFRIIICIIIYLVLYFIKNSNYFFSEDVINKANQILSYDMNIQAIYDDFIGYLENLNINELNDAQNVEDENQMENSQEDENEQNETNETQEEENKSEDKNEEINQGEQTNGGVGGADEQIDIENEEQISQMEIDANYIKDNFEIIVPVQGTITSRFGIRTPTDIISANHAGIDIGADEGTKIVSAMEGKVSLVSETGDYGNHVVIETGDVTILYAHCKTIYVGEGEEVKKGTEIAEVGQTGRATRTTLAF